MQHRAYNKRIINKKLSTFVLSCELVMNSCGNHLKANRMLGNKKQEDSLFPLALDFLLSVHLSDRLRKC